MRVTPGTIRAWVRTFVRQEIRQLFPGRLDRVDQTSYRAELRSFLPTEVARRVKPIHPYGLISRPKPGMEALVGAVGGSSRNLVWIGVNDSQYRVTELESGEVAIYDDLGKTVIFKRDGRIEVRAPELDVETEGDVRVQAGGNIEAHADGNLDASADGQVDIQSGGDATIDSGGKLTASAALDVEVDTPLNARVQTGLDLEATVLGALLATVTGAATIDAQGILSLISATQVAINAPLVTIDGAVVDIQGVGDYKIHRHPGVQSGGSLTGGPT